MYNQKFNLYLSIFVEDTDVQLNLKYYTCTAKFKYMSLNTCKYTVKVVLVDNTADHNNIKCSSANPISNDGR
jgi:hypothetical protein